MTLHTPPGDNNTPKGGPGCTCKPAGDGVWITNYCTHHDPIYRMMRGDEVIFDGLQGLVGDEGVGYDDL